MKIIKVMVLFLVLLAFVLIGVLSLRNLSYSIFYIIVGYLGYILLEKIDEVKKNER